MLLKIQDSPFNLSGNKQTEMEKCCILGKYTSQENDVDLSFPQSFKNIIHLM